jgi:uncharacterized protein YuzE
MEIKLDTKADALYIRLKKGKVYKTVENERSYLVDLDKKGAVLGIEVLHYSQIASKTGKMLFSVSGRKSVLVPA